jgi:hypothetical protein
MDNTSGFNWTGTLYATTGNYFPTMPFNPADVTLTNVGTMTWQGQTTTTGTLTYVVDGITVVKNVVRQTLVLDDFSGHYFGGIHEELAGCANPALNVTFEQSGYVYLTQTGSTASVETVTSGATCNFSAATIAEYGQMGNSQGTFSCSDGEAGSYQFLEMQVNVEGLTSRFALSFSSPPGCQATGWFGGLRGTTF